MHRPGSRQQQMTQPGLQHLEFLWDIFEIRNQLAFETKFIVHEAAASLAKKHLQISTKVYFVLVLYIKDPSLCFNNLSSISGSNVFSTRSHL